MKKILSIVVSVMIIGLPVWSGTYIKDETQALKEAKEQQGVSTEKLYQDVDLQLTQPAKVFQFNFEPPEKHKRADLEYNKYPEGVPNRVILNGK